MNKDKIFKIIIITIILIVPIIYYWYAGYISIASYTAHIYDKTINDSLLIEASKQSLELFTIFTKEYIIYLILLLLNYILYKKNLNKPLLIINGLIIIYFIYYIISNFVFNSRFIPLDTLLFLVSAIIGILLNIKLRKEKRN